MVDCSAADIKLDDVFKALLLLSSLPDNWEVLFVTLTNSSSNGKLVMSVVKENMLNEEAMTKECGLIVTLTQSEALVTESRGRSQIRNFHKCYMPESHNKSRTTKEFVCYHCGNKGQIKRYCRLLK